MASEMLFTLGAVFVTIAVATGSVAWWWMVQASPEQQRLRTFAQPSATGLTLPQAPLAENADPTLERLRRLVPKSPKDMSRLQRRLAKAGYPRFKSAVYYALAQVLLAPVFAGVTLLMVGVRTGWMYAALAGVVGYLLPSFYVARKTTLRQKAIQNGLPDVLDLLTVCVEAGSGLDQAIVKASEELAITHPALADELKMITTEMRAGKPRMEALRNFAKRTGVEDVRTLVAMLMQTDRFGTSVAQALRTHSETSRTKRRQRAEERAAKVSVKLVFPLALCLFPALYVVCFGPVVVKIYRAFFTGSL